MSEFDVWGTESGGQQAAPSGGGRPPRKGGQWFFPLTLLGIALVGGLSMLMCWLTRDVQDRPIWMMGLIFMVPAGAMFFSTMLLEFNTGVMTPSSSRKPQVITAVVATLLTFLVGCLCDAVYLYGGLIRDAGVNFVFAVDRGDTTDWPAYDQADGPTRGEELNDCAEDLLRKMPKYTDVGLVTFSWEPVESHALAKADAEYKKSFSSWLEVCGSEGVSYVNALDSAISLLQQTGNGLPTRILLLTGGDEALYLINETGDVQSNIVDVPAEACLTLQTQASRDAIIQRLTDADCTLYVISPDGGISADLRAVAEATGGLCVSIDEAGTVAEFVSILKVDGDMLRSGSVLAAVMTGVMLLLEGAVVGVCLSIMLSRQGQKRFQAILSPLMAVVSFVMLKLIVSPDSFPDGAWWAWEGMSFLPLGVIFMKTSDLSSAPYTPAAQDIWGGNELPGGADDWGTGSGGNSGSSGGFDFGGGSDGGFDLNASGASDDWSNSSSSADTTTSNIDW